MTENVGPYLTKEEVCKILGVKESWLNAEIQAGNISHIRLGQKKFIRFRPEHVEEYVKSREWNISADPFDTDQSDN